MNFRFFTKLNKFGHKKIIPKNSAHIIENIAAAALCITQAERIRRILEQGGSIRGWTTVEHGIWHDDPNGELVVNGRRGYYTYEKIVEFKEIPSEFIENLLTNGGRDFAHNQVYTNTAAGTRGAGFIGLSENAVAPAATDTALTGEITTGGLARADASTKTHTNGTNTTTIEHTFTATAAFTAVQKAALFNAATVGTMANENTFTTVALQINDTLKVTWTITMG